MCHCAKDKDGHTDFSRVIKCKYRQKGDTQTISSHLERLKSNIKPTLWKHITIEVKKRIDLDGCPAYIVTASDLLSQQKKSLIVDAPIIDEQDVTKLQQHFIKSGIHIANHGA